MTGRAKAGLSSYIIGSIANPHEPPRTIMDVEEVLEFADHLVFAMTGKHLDSLQQAILRGAWDNQKYRQIAQRLHRSEKYVKEVGFKLWHLLSDILGEEVNKSNFRAALERRWRFSFVLNFGKTFVSSNNIYPEILQSLELPDQFDEEIAVGFEEAPVLSLSAAPNLAPIQDLGEAPDVSVFYGRAEELALLEKWIVQERCRLVALLGSGGIGKTTLATKLVEKVKDKFDYAIWRSLRSCPPRAALETNLIQFLSNSHPYYPWAGRSLSRSLSRNLQALSPDDLFSQLVEFLRQYRCLVVLDDVEMLFDRNQFAGRYQTGSENYSSLFRSIGELSHQSCLVLIGSEQPREIARLESGNQHCRSLQVRGLGTEAATDLLARHSLAEDLAEGLAEGDWETLISYYQGNPSWLKIAATMIKDLFGGSVSELLQYDPLFLCDDLKCQLDSQCDRLSALEKQVMSALARESEPVSLSKLRQHIPLLSGNLPDALQSLLRRYLIEKQQENRATLFSLQPLVRQYVKTKYFPADKNVSSISSLG